MDSRSHDPIIDSPCLFTALIPWTDGSSVSRRIECNEVVYLQRRIIELLIQELYGKEGGGNEQNGRAPVLPRIARVVSRKVTAPVDIELVAVS